MSTEISYARGKDICLIGKGQACCRYVVGDISAGGAIRCAKHEPLGRYLDKRVQEGRMIAQGDNCEGLI